jgi:tripartite-type tricarboxylate transporter receptor subunit TctC
MATRYSPAAAASPRCCRHSPPAQATIRPRILRQLPNFMEAFQIPVVHSSSPWTLVKDLVDDPRVHRGALNWAHSDTAGLPQLAGELFMTRAGIRIVGVPYRSGGESVTAVLSQAEAEARLKISLM